MQESRGCGIYKNEFMGEGIKENLYNYFCLTLTAIYLHFEWNIPRYKMLWDCIRMNSWVKELKKTSTTIFV